ncbi:hypothetical protein IAD21_00698 [Abditibacteriota bacterium]|nr:hypothetical protein IAD21_00698 [Abditibacteriota bacterium]
MDNNKPLTEEELVSLRLHIAGATVKHQNPFSELPVPRSDASLSQEMVQKWVVSFYMRRMKSQDDIPWYGADVKPTYLQNINAQSSDFALACAQATPELALSLLAKFNWRPRVVGARCVAVRQFFELQAEISALFLRSDVCYAGSAYCLTLTSLGNAAAAETLATYLDYYLNRPDLYFDQGEAMAALLYLDERMGTNRAVSLANVWQLFVRDKPHWDLDRFNTSFRESIGIIQEIRQIITRGKEVGVRNKEPD